MKWSLMLIRSLGFILLLIASANAAAQGTQIQGPRNAADVYSGVVYGPIDQSDTLWAISSQYRKNQQFTVYQVMLAIYELNPRAFNNRNFNTMVNGSMLQLPTDRYIARIDPQRALAKAQQDDRDFAQATGRQGKSVASENADADVQTNLKPDVPLVNKEELDEAQQRFQQQINRLRNQQSQVVKQLREQLDVSIQATQSIVDENRLVLETLAAKDEEFNTLKTELSEQFETELNQQAAEIRELKEFVRLMQMREEQTKQDSMGSIIRDPLFIIISTTVAGFLIFVLIALLLLRKPKPQNIEDVPVPSELDDDLVLDDAASKDADDLLAMLESDNVSDDELLDDILSDELEETIDEISPDINDFGDLEDEMLVPDQKDDNKGSDISDEDDLDIDDLDLDSLDSDLGDLESPTDEDDFSLDEDEISLDDDLESVLDDDASTENALTEDDEPPEVDIEQMLEGGDVNITNAIDASSIDNDDLGLEDDFAELTEDDVDISASTNLTESDDEQDEISIDDLLEQNALDGDVPDGISLDPSGEITENVIEQIEAEITEKNIEINTLTDSLIDDIESNNYEEDDDLDLTDEQALPSSGASESQRSIQSIDELTKDVEADIAEVLAESEAELDEISDDVDVQELSDPLNDELLSELGVELPEEDDNDVFDLSDSGIDEDENEDNIDVDAEEGSEEIDIDSVLDESLDDLLNNHVDDEDLDSNRDALLNEILETNSSTSSPEPQQLEGSQVQEESEQLTDSNDLDSVNDSNEFTPQDSVIDEVDEFINVDADGSQGSDDFSDLTDELLTELDNDLDDKLEVDTDELDDIDLSELDIEPSSESESKELEEAIDDSILDLPDLDDWLDDDNSTSKEEDFLASDDQSALAESKTERSTEDDVLQEIEEADFDSLLADMGALEDDTGSKLADLEVEETAEKIDTKAEAESKEDLALDNPDLDLTALFDDPDGVKDPDSDFIDVDNLIEESEKLPPASDDEIELNIDMSLDSFLNNDTSIDVDMNADQASNLDLARVYIDMEDTEAAIELLDEVAEKGDDEQQEEAKLLLAQLKG